MMKLIQNAKMLEAGTLKKVDVLIEGKTVKQIAETIEPTEDMTVIDAKGHF